MLCVGWVLFVCAANVAVVTNVRLKYMILVYVITPVVVVVFVVKNRGVVFVLAHSDTWRGNSVLVERTCVWRSLARVYIEFQKKKTPIPYDVHAFFCHHAGASTHMIYMIQHDTNYFF